MTPSTEAEWIARVNRAMDRVLASRGERLDLNQVARAVHASPYHFHRIFRALVGETLHAFQKRVRLERALQKMSQSPGKMLTDIAIECGFSDSASFSRAFRDQYGVAPSAFDLDAWRAKRRDELTGGGAHKMLERLPVGENPDGFRVRLRSLPERLFAYMRVTDPYQPGRVAGAAEELVGWAERNELADGNWYGWMWENPDLVPLAQCRYDVAVEVPEGTAVQGSVALQHMPAMMVAELALAGDIGLEQRALDWLYGTWLPRCGREPGDLPCFEAWNGRPFAHGFEHFELAIHVPLGGTLRTSPR